MIDIGYHCPPRTWRTALRPINPRIDVRPFGADHVSDVTAAMPPRLATSSIDDVAKRGGQLDVSDRLIYSANEER